MMKGNAPPAEKPFYWRRLTRVERLSYYCWPNPFPMVGDPWVPPGKTKQEVLYAVAMEEKRKRCTPRP